MRDARALAGPRIAAIGPGTARALRAGGVEADVVPSARWPSRSSRRSQTVDVSRALIVRAEEARDVLPDALRARGAEVDVLALYRTVASRWTTRRARPRWAPDYLTFASASAVRFFHEAAGSLEGPRLVSIGPVTSAALRGWAPSPHVEAAEHTPDGLVAALVADARRVGSARCASSSWAPAASAPPSPPSPAAAPSSSAW